MGAIKNVINSIDNSNEIGQAQKELLESLNQTAIAKAESFKYQIEESLRTSGTSSNARVPISSIVKDSYVIRSFISSEITNISSETNNILTKFSEGTAQSIIQGVGSVIGTALGRFLGESTAETLMFEDYYVYTDQYSVLRIDLKAWYQNIKIQSLRDKVEKVTAIVYTKSVVDLTKIDFSTLLYFYQNQLRKSSMDSEEISDALELAKKIYKEFRDINKDSKIESPTPLNIPPSSFS